MPTVFVVDGYRFFIFSNEGQEPPHVHVERGDALGKWWLIPRLTLAKSYDMKPASSEQSRRSSESVERNC